MPVINGVYTKDFPALGRAPIDTDIIPIAEVANQITYKSTIGEIFNAKVFGTTGRLSKFTSANTLGNSILNEIGNAIHLTNGGTSYASFGIINPGTPGDPGIDNDAYIGSTINNDFTIRVNNTEAARFDTALRFKIANIQNATTDTDKFLVSDGGVVKYRTGAQVLSDIGAQPSGSYVTLDTTQTITGAKTFSLDSSFNGVNIGRGGGSINTNIRIGLGSLGSNTTGSVNTSIGYGSLQFNTTGSENTSFGFYSLLNNTTGTSNISLGYNSMSSNTAGTSNVSIGSSALALNTTGNTNIAIGNYAGSYTHTPTVSNQTSTNSIYLGYDTRSSANGNTNEIVIGHNTLGGGSNSVTLGNASILITNLQGNVGIGYTTNPSLYKLDVNGTGRFTGALNGTSATFSGAVQGASFSTAGLISGEVFRGNKSNAGYYVGVFQNTSATGLGILVENGNDNNDAIRIGNAAGTDNPIRLFGSGKAYFGGNVGIGTTSPIDKLQVNGGKSIFASSNFNGTNAGGAVFVFSDDNNGGKIWTQKNGNSDWGYLSLQPLGGNVGIGTTSPTRQLTVQSQDDGNLQLRLQGTASTTSYWEIGRESLSSGQFRFIASRNGTVITPMAIGDVSGNVLIGSTNDTGLYKLDVNGTGRFNATGNSGDILSINASGGNYIKFGGIASGTSYLYSFETAFNIGNAYSGGSLNLYAGNSSRLTIASTGAATFSSSVATTGVIFPATQVASADPNTLDDYEEGTWTPVLSGGGSNPSVVYSGGNTGGIYTKIGNVVNITFEVRWSSFSGGSGAVQISGLPFTRKNTNLPDGERLIIDSYNNTINGLYLIGNIRTNTNNIELSIVRSGNTTIDLNISDLIASGIGFLRGSCTYFV